MIQQFAEEQKVKVSRAECGEVIVRAKVGQIFSDHGVVCAMWTDAGPMMKSRLQQLGGQVSQGDISRGAKRPGCLACRNWPALLRGFSRSRLRSRFRSR